MELEEYELNGTDIDIEMGLNSWDYPQTDCIIPSPHVARIQYTPHHLTSSTPAIPHKTRTPSPSRGRLHRRHRLLRGRLLHAVWRHIRSLFQIRILILTLIRIQIRIWF